MNTINKLTTASQNTMPPELASAVNLMAHPVAGMAAVGALGLGVASHAFGLWVGAVAGVSEASQKLLFGRVETEKRALPAGKLRLVASQPVADRRAARHEAAAAMKLAGNARPALPDDLKAISGVGPKLEKILNGLGFWSYAQIAALDKAQIARLDRQLGFAGRINRDDWVGQAARFLSGSK